MFSRYAILLHSLGLLYLHVGIAKASIFSVEAKRLERAIHLIEKQTFYNPLRSKQQDLRVLYNNLARFKNAEAFKEERFLLVDITGYKVKLYERKKVLFEARALVGQRRTPTHSFQSNITNVVLNPWWIIPKEIATKEIIPLIEREPDVLSTNGFYAFDFDQGRWAPVIDSLKSRKALLKESFRYVLKQAPGPFNPLGNVKFLLANPYSIILHGSSEPELFALDNRALSHGCVRIERADELASILLLADQPKQWNPERFGNLLSLGKEATLVLRKKIPIYFGYWTAWVDKNGQIHFRNDIYGWD